MLLEAATVLLLGASLGTAHGTAGGSSAAITYAKLAGTDSHVPAAKSGACAGGTCQSLCCAPAVTCGTVPCRHGGPSVRHDVPCDIAALQIACSANPLCGGFNSDGWLKPCVNTSCGAEYSKLGGVDTYVSSRVMPPPPPSPSPSPPPVPPPPGPPPPPDHLPLIEDWHYPAEEAEEMAALLAVGLHVTALRVTSNTSGELTLAAANGSSASASAPGDRLFGWELRGFLLGAGGDSDAEGPLAVLQHNAARWGYIVFVCDKQVLLSPEPGGGVQGLRKGVGRAQDVRRPHYNLTAVDPAYFKNAAAEGGDDFIKQSMEAASTFEETTFAAAASTLAPPHDYAIVGNVDSHTKFSVAQDGRVKLANFSIYSPTLEGDNTNGTGDGGGGGGGPGGDVLVFDPRRYMSWWPEQNFSDYKTSILGRYTRAVTLAAWDQQHQHGFTMTAVPNTRKGIETHPYDVAELLIELEEYGKPPRYFAVRGCVTSGSVVAANAKGGGGCASASGMADCRLMTFCTAPTDSTATELPDGGALFHANLLAHCASWQAFFAPAKAGSSGGGGGGGGGGMQLSLGHDASESSRLLDMGRGTMVVGMTTFIGPRPNYGDVKRFPIHRAILPFPSISADSHGNRPMGPLGGQLLERERQGQRLVAARILRAGPCAAAVGEGRCGC